MGFRDFAWYPSEVAQALINAYGGPNWMGAAFEKMANTSAKQMKPGSGRGGGGKRIVEWNIAGHRDADAADDKHGACQRGSLLYLFTGC